MESVTRRSRRWRSVSYTHLDVYKRQQQIQREVRTKLASISNTPCSRGMTNEQIKDIKYNGTGDFPVSYTHLDVYKRQM